METGPKFVNIGTEEKPNFVQKELVMGKSFQSKEDHSAEGIASGSINPDGFPNLNINLNTPNEQKP